ncbi:MAG TPA: hypothetical protein VFV89_07360 [Nocardioides sp.]|uniref:hypothetical protein n=1 Tax=Nocardioides sp. TaxID=35761 RepID=UPI002E374318|nr:hypothetical protein [Nocardioides sp.]HEX5087608.1 hypothetical protein [Nocardioides sp.]
MRGRTLIGTLGVLLGLYGAWLLVSRQDRAQLVGAAKWLVAGVVLHDFVLAPLTLVVVAGLARLLPVSHRAPAAVGLVVLGSVTLLAIPVLGSFGAQTHNPSLLDRHYVIGWLVLAALTVACVVVAGERRRRTP